MVPSVEEKYMSWDPQTKLPGSIQETITAQHPQFTKKHTFSDQYIYCLQIYPQRLMWKCTILLVVDRNSWYLY